MATDLELLLMAQTAPLAVPVNAAPTATASAGSPAAATETIDSVLGVYQCTLVAGRRYVALMNGLTGNCGTAGDIYLCNIRNSGSSSTPSASSTLVAQTQWTSAASGSASRTGIALAGSFLAPATGLNTFAFFAQRISGAGSFTPVSPNAGSRELYVMYLGTV